MAEPIPIDDEHLSILEELERRQELTPEDEADLATARTTRSQFSRANVLNYTMQQNADSMSDDHARGLSDLFAKYMDVGNRELTTQPGARTQLTGDQYFQNIKNPRDRIKFIQNQYDPARHKDILSDYQKFVALDPDAKFVEAQTRGRELFGILPARENIPVGYVGRQLGFAAEVVFSAWEGMAAVAEFDPQQEFGLNTAEKRQRLMDRVESALLQKDLATLRSRYDSLLSEDSKEFAKQTAASGVWSDNLFASLPIVEQELTARYTYLLRDYSEAGRFSEFMYKGGASIFGVVENDADFLVNKTANALFVIQTIWNDEGNQSLLELDDFRRIDRLKDMAMSKKFQERGPVAQGAMILADSIGPMLFAAKTGPMRLLTGTMAIASYAKTTEDMMLDAGASPESAGLIAPVAGVAMFYTERLNSVFSMNSAQKKVLSKVVSETLLTKVNTALLQGAKTIGSETAEEILQSLQETIAKQTGLGEIDEAELAGVTAETIEQMAKAGLWFAATGAGIPRIARGVQTAAPVARDMITRLGAGKADIDANDAVMATNEFEGKAERKEMTIDEVMDAMPADIPVPALQDILTRHGVPNATEVATRMVDMKGQEAQTAKQVEKTVDIGFRSITTKEEAGVSKVAKKAGLAVEIVDEVTDEAGVLVAGAIQDGVLKISRIVEADPAQVAQELVMAATTGGKSAAQVEKREKVVVRPQQGGAQATTEFETDTAELEYYDVPMGKSAMGSPVSRYKAANPRALATRVAIGRIAGGLPVTVRHLQAMFPTSDLDFESIIEDARDEVNSIRDFEEGVAERSAQYTKSARRREVLRAQRQAVRLGREGVKTEMEAKTRAAAARVTAKDRAVKEAGLSANGIALTAVPSMMMGVVNGTTPSDVYTVMSQMVSNIDGAVDTQAFKTSYRATLAKVLGSVSRTAVALKNRTKITTDINKFGAPRTGDSIARINKSFARIRDMIQEGAQKTNRKEIIARMNGVIDKALSRKNTDKFTDVFRRENYSFVDVSVLKAYGRATRMDEESVAEVVDSATALMDAMNSQPDAREAARTVILKALPSLKNIKLSDSDLGNIALTSANVFGSLKTLTNADLQLASDTLDTFLQSANANQVAVLRAKQDADAAAIAGVTGSLAAMAGRFTGFTQLSSSLATPLQFLETLMSGALKDSEQDLNFFNSILAPMVNARGRYRSRELEMENMLLDRAKKIYKTKKELDVNSKENMDWEKWSVTSRPLTKWQVINTVLMLENADVQERAELEDNEAILKQIKQLPEMRKVLTDADVLYLEELRTMVDSKFPEVSERFRKLTGSELVQADLYWPIAHHDPKKGLSSSSGSGISIIKSFLKSRVPNVHPLQTDIDVNSQFISHMNAVNRFIEYADAQIIARDILFSTEVLGELEKLFGSDYKNRFMASVYDEVSGPYVSGDSSWLVEKARSWVIQAAIPFNAYSSLKQIADLPSVAAELGFKFWPYLATSFGKEGRESYQAMMNHPAFKADIALGGHPELVTQFKQRLNEGGPASIYNFMKDIVTRTDAFSRILAAPAILRTVRETARIKSIADPTLREETAMNLAVRIMQETLQSPVQADRPYMARRGGSAGKFLTIFTSALTPKIASTALALDAAINQRDTASVGRLAQKLLYFHLVAGILQYSVRILINLGVREEEEDDMWRDALVSILMGPMGGIPLAGALLDSTLRSLTGQTAVLRQPISLIGETVFGLGETIYHTSQGEFEEAWAAAIDTVVGATAAGRVSENMLQKFDVIEK